MKKFVYFKALFWWLIRNCKSLKIYENGQSFRDICGYNSVIPTSSLNMYIDKLIAYLIVLYFNALLLMVLSEIASCQKYAKVVNVSEICLVITR